MKKRILCILLILCMVLSILPLTAYAEETQEVTHYKIWIEGEEITSSRLSGQSGWSYDPDTCTLYLRNYQTSTLGYHNGQYQDKYDIYTLIYSPWVDNLTIHLSGDNVLGDDSFPYEAYDGNKRVINGITALGNLTITGDPGAKLKIYTHDNSIYAKNLTLKGNITLNTASQITSVFTVENLTMEGNCKLFATCTSVFKGLSAVSVGENLHVQEGFYLDATAVAKSKWYSGVQDGIHLNGYKHHENYICSIYVGNEAYIDGGKVLAYFDKKDSSYISSDTYYEEKYGSTKAFFACSIYRQRR